MKARTWIGGTLLIGVACSVIKCSTNYRGGNDGGLDGATVDGGGTSPKDATSEFSAMPGTCTLPQFYSNACQPCADTNCCSQQQRCAQMPECNAWVACIVQCAKTVGCPNTPCEDSCTLNHKPGYYAFRGQMGYGPDANVDLCVSQNCTSSCAISCPP